MVVAPVVEEAQRARRPVILVFEGHGGHAARDALVVVDIGLVGGAGVGGVEVGDVDVGPKAPLPGQVVGEAGIAAILLEAHAVAVAVGAAVRAGDDAAQAAAAHAVGGLGLERAVGAAAEVGVGAHAVVPHATGDEVDHAAHGSRTVKHRSRAAQHLDALHHHRLVGVGDGVAHQAHVLRMAVDEHEHTRRGQSVLCWPADAAHRYLPGAAARDAVAHQAALGREKAWHQRIEHGQYGRFVALFELTPPHGGEGHGQVAHVGGVACAGDDGFVQRAAGQRVGAGLLCPRAGG